MWQPNRAQWRVIWPLAIALVLLWPPDSSPSLGVKAIHWLADPADVLPRLPDELPMELGDNGDAVAAHDAQAAEYYRLKEGSAWVRARMRLEEVSDPIAASTMRQILGAAALLGALGIWRLGTREAR